MATKHTRFITGANSMNGLQGYLQRLLPIYGTATVPNGATSVVVTDAFAKTGDFILATVMTKGANACHVVGATISNGVSFTISVNTDPGAGGAVIFFARISAQIATP